MLELIQIFIDNIAPILIVAGTGYLAGRRLNMDARFLGQLIFNVFSPALAFYLLYTSEIQPGEMVTLFIATISFQSLMALLAFVVMRLQHADRADRAVIMISSFCLNAGNYGLSLVSFAYGSDVLARAVIVFVSNLVLNYTLGVFVASSGHHTLRQSMLGILRVPTVYAIPAALLLRTITPDLPLVLMRPISLLSDAAIPCMLILLGLQLSQSARPGKFRLLTSGVVLKMLIAPFIGVGLALLLNLDAFARVAFITQVSMPTAVVTLILASEYKLDRDFSLNLILITTLLSPVTLSVLIWILRPALNT